MSWRDWLRRLAGPDPLAELLEGALAEQDIDFPSEFGTPYSRRDAERLGRPQSQANEPQEWSYVERREQLLRAHQAWERNPLAKQGVGLIRRFVVGQGVQLAYRSPVVENIIEAWRRQHRQHVERWEKQLFDQLLVDGELFLRRFSNGLQDEFADVRVLPLKPWLVEAVETEPEDRTEVVAYWIVPETGSGAPTSPVHTTGTSQRIDADEIVHCAINSLAYEVRGRPELFAILPWLTAHKQWLENRARINRYLGVLYHLQAQGAGPSQIAAIRSRFRRPPEPNSILVTSDRETLTKLDQDVGARDASEDGRQIKLMSIVGLGLPEYMMADGENSNLATTKSQQLPALKSFADYQDIYTKQVWRPIYEAVLLATLGDLDKMVDAVDDDGQPTSEQVRICDAFDVTLPDIVEDDPKNLAEALAIHAANGWVSTRTASQRAGYDWEQEQKYMSAERQELPPTYGAPPEDEGEPEEEPEEEPNNAEVP